MMTSSSEEVLSFDDSGSLKTESPKPALQTSSLVSITLSSSMTSLPRALAGDDGSAFTTAASSSGKSSKKKKVRAAKKKKNKKTSTRSSSSSNSPGVCSALSLFLQLIFFLLALIASLVGWYNFEENMRMGYGISAFLQFVLLFILSMTLCLGGRGFLACFNAALLALAENIVVLHIISTDWNDEKCDLDGCTWLQGPLAHRLAFVVLHGVFGLFHLIMTFGLGIQGCQASRRSTPSAAATVETQAVSAESAAAPRKARKTRRQHRRRSTTVSRSSKASGGGISSVRSYNVQIYGPKTAAATSTASSSYRVEQQPQQYQQQAAYPIYPGTSSHATTPQLPYYHQNAGAAALQHQQYANAAPLQPSAVYNHGREMVFDVPKTQQPRGFVDIQRVVVKLPPLKPSESANVCQSLRDTSSGSAASSYYSNNNPQQPQPQHQLSAAPGERVYCTKITPLN